MQVQKHPHRPLGIFVLAFRRLQIQPFPAAGQPVLHVVARLGKQEGKPFRPEPAQKFVRVLALGQGKHPHLQPRRAQDVDIPVRRFATCFIRVPCYNNLTCIPRHQTGLVGGQGGAQGSHGIFKPRLVHGDDIHIPFGENQRPVGLILG